MTDLSNNSNRTYQVFRQVNGTKIDGRVRYLNYRTYKDIMVRLKKSLTQWNGKVSDKSETDNSKYTYHHKTAKEVVVQWQITENLLTIQEWQGPVVNQWQIVQVYLP